MKKKQKEQLALAVAIVMMILIFISSSMPYQEQSSVGFLKVLLKDKPFETELRAFSFVYAGSVVSIQENGYFQFIEFFIRKFAHFSSFFIMGYCWQYALLPKARYKQSTFVTTVLICFSYAVCDEFHQSITPNRTALIEDVILDTTGAFFGAIVVMVHTLFFRKRRY